MFAVTAVAFWTYVLGFGFPAVPFWDERYYIVDAQKYLHGVYFLDLHPPLGKLLIALGEWLVGQNARTDDFLNVTYYAQTVPDGFSFVGFRVIPVLFAWMTAPILFAIFFKLVRSRLLACMLCGLYVFDNALIVHLRGAMLEGPLLFFTSALLLATINLVDFQALSRWRFRMWALLAGIALGCIVTTKAIGAAFLLVPVALIWRFRHNRRLALEGALTTAVGGFLVIVAVWEVHFSLARRVNPALLEAGFYQTPSDGARAFLDGPDRVPVIALPALIGEAVRYARWYDAARPAIDFCRQDERASPFWMWPIGARSVPYWWDTADGGKSFRYLYLQVNPVVWWTALAGLIAAVLLLVGSAIAPPARPLKHRFLLTMFTGLYFAYFVPLRWVHGVMFLYHYFIPLMLTFVLLALVVDEITSLGRRTITMGHKQTALALWLAAVVACFWIYKPMTYYERPLTSEALQRRAVVALWDLRCVTCPHVDGLCTSAPK